MEMIRAVERCKARLKLLTSLFSIYRCRLFALESTKVRHMLISTFSLVNGLWVIYLTNQTAFEK